MNYLEGKKGIGSGSGVLLKDMLTFFTFGGTMMWGT